jgi:hypothetical protein
MKYVKPFLFVLSLLAYSNCHALLITDTISFNNKLNQDWHQFTFELIPQGYNPITDTINFVSLTIDIREIVEDPFEDNGSMEEYREWVTIYDWFLFHRAYIADVDTGVFTEKAAWYPTEDCRYPASEPGGECLFQPDQDGLFYSSWQVATDNLWLNSLSLTLDVTRKDLDEPSPLFLFLSLLPLLAFRFRNRSAKNI